MPPLGPGGSVEADVADPTPFLSTITGASAGLVAIIGGLLVNKFIGIDSEQQGAQAMLDQADDRLRIARARAKDAQQTWESFEVSQFLNRSEVLDAIRDGMQEAAELGPELLESTPLTVEQLRPHLRDAAEEFARACALFDGKLPPAAVRSAEDWQNSTWESARIHLKIDLPATRRPAVWDRAFKAVTQVRAQQRKDQGFADLQAKFPSAGFRERLMSGLEIPPSAFIRSISNQAAQRIEQQRTRLTTEKERTAQHLEDADAEATRLRVTGTSRRDRPSRQAAVDRDRRAAIPHHRRHRAARARHAYRADGVHWGDPHTGSAVRDRARRAAGVHGLPRSTPLPRPRPRPPSTAAGAKPAGGYRPTGTRIDSHCGAMIPTARFPAPAVAPPGQQLRFHQVGKPERGSIYAP